MFNKKCVLILICCLLILCGFGFKSVYADEIRVGASPTIFDDVRIQPGGQETIKINVANSSVISKSSNLSDFTYDINIYPRDRKEDDFSSLSPSDRKLVDSSTWVTLDKTKLTLAPGDVKAVEATFNVPKGVATGEYICLVHISPVEVVSPNQVKLKVSFLPSLDVTVIIHVVNSKSEILNYNYKCTGFTMDDNTPSKSMFQLIKGLVGLSGSVSDNWNDFLHKPLKLQVGSSVYYDIPVLEKVYITDAIVNDKSKLTDEKYVISPKGLTEDCIVKGLTFNDKIMEVDTNKGKFDVDLNNDNIALEVKLQATTYASTLDKDSADSLTWGTLAQHITLNRYLSLSDISLIAKCKITNTGTVTIVLQGTLLATNTLTKNDIAQAVYGQTVILPGDSKDIMAVMDYNGDKFSPSEYKITSTLIPYKGCKADVKIDYIHVSNLRNYIIAGFIISSLLLLTVLTFITVKIIKIIKRKVKNNGENKKEITT